MKLAQFTPPQTQGEGGAYGERVAPRDLVGSVILARVNKHTAEVQTKFGVTGAIDLDVCGVGTGKVAMGQRWFNGAITDALAGYVGQVVVVKVVWRESKDGRPYLALDPVSEAEQVQAQELTDKGDPFGSDQAAPVAEQAAPDDAPRW